APPGVAVLGPRPRTAKPRTRGSSQWPQTVDSALAAAAGQAQPAGPSPVGIAASERLAARRQHPMLLSALTVSGARCRSKLQPGARIAAGGIYSTGVWDERTSNA